MEIRFLNELSGKRLTRKVLSTTFVLLGVAVRSAYADSITISKTITRTFEDRFDPTNRGYAGGPGRDR